MQGEIKLDQSYYAHSGNNSDKSDWQLLSEHLSKVGRKAAENARFFNSESLAEISGLLHDVGKYTQEFADRLEGGKRVDHATAGAQLAVDKWGRLGKLLAYGIAGHHAGLANGNDVGKNRSTLEIRLSKTIPELDDIWQMEVPIPDKLSFPPMKIIKHFDGFQMAFLVRMLFSCLVDADYIDTEYFYCQLDGKKKRNNYYPALPQLQLALNSYINELTKKSARKHPGEVNDIRREILEHSRKQATLNHGLFSLTVPTGGGKTLTSMAFALDHAIQHQLRRVIYVIPFTSIIEQNAKVFREAFQPLGDNIVLEHHSAFDEEKLNAKHQTKDKLRLAMENWDAPVVVTTAVQFFESLFADRTSKCRKLHNITGSVIILDEAQMLPLKLLRPTMATIDELARNYQCTIVLCTATQPALLHPEFINGFQNVREIAPEPDSLYRSLDRVTVRHIGEQTDQQLVEVINSTDQILVIVNNRRHAHALSELISSHYSHFHLTTLMCARHRSKILETIKERLSLGKSCQVISTSLIEAGVDISFPIVMRAETGLDSIAQAAGRCNREGLYSKENSEVLIFSTPDWKAPPELDQYAASLRHVMRNHQGDLLAPEAIKAYFEDVYWRKGDELDAKNLLKTHQDHLAHISFPFQDIASDYRIIESYMQPIIISYDDNAKKLIEQLCYADFVGSIARKLQQYIVQIPQRAFDELVKVGAITAIQPEQFGEQFWELTNESLYSSEAGINWDDPTFIKVEKMII